MTHHLKLCSKEEDLEVEVGMLLGTEVALAWEGLGWCRIMQTHVHVHVHVHVHNIIDVRHCMIWYAHKQTYTYMLLLRIHKYVDIQPSTPTCTNTHARMRAPPHPPPPHTHTHHTPPAAGTAAEGV